MPALPTIAGEPIPDAPDVPRMRAERERRLHQQLDAQGLDGLLLLGSSAVSYATGVHLPGTDSGRAALMRMVAIMARGESPRLVVAYPDTDSGAEQLVGQVRDLIGGSGRLGVDEVPHPLLRALAGFDLVPATSVLAPAKLCKTADELACIRAAQHLNELAMRDVQPLVRPGVRPTELSGRFLRRIFELGVDANGIDPIWQPMPATKASGPWTVHGDIAFPTPSTTRPFRDGDVVWVDTGIHVEGYASDFGRTWLAGTDPRPSPRQRDQYRRWQAVMDAVLAVMKPGASGLDLCRAAIDANRGVKPWIEHFYLAHGVGTDSAEMPLIGTDLGEAFDEKLVLAPGMVLVLEPVIWDDGAAGYRSEDVYAITDDGWAQLSDYSYDPFGER